MRILHVINTLATGGAEKLVSDIVPLVKSYGHTIDVMILQNSKSLFENNLIQNNINIINLNCPNIYNPWTAVKIIPYLKKYDIIHVHLFPAQYWVALAKMLCFSKVKLVTTEHCTKNSRREKSFFRIIDRRIYKCYKKIISVSKETHDSLLEWVCPKRRVDRYTIIENGVNIQAIVDAAPYSKAQLGVNEQDKIIMMVGRFEESKDQDTLLKALAILPSHIHLFLVGDGSRRKQLETQTEELSISNRVHFLGLRNDVPRLIKSADVCVLSSHFEGLPLAAIEGMAAGPFVASDVGGLNEIISGAGILFPEGNEVALAEAIAKLLSNDAYYNDVKKMCSDRAKKYDINKMVKEYIHVYESL